MSFFRTIVAAAACAAAYSILPIAASAAMVPHNEFFIPSVISIDATTHTAIFPLHRGTSHGTTVWYILTDASDAGTAKSLGLDFAPDIADLGDAAIVHATKAANGEAAFPGAPDFAPVRTYVASTGGFPPKSATPGGTGGDTYSPYVRIDGTPGVLNAPIVATGNGPFDVTNHTNTHDRVIAIDTVKNTVTLVLARGFDSGRPVYYLSTEASDPVASSVERATYAPLLAKAASAGSIPIGVVVNGPLTGDGSVQGLAYLTLRTPISENATSGNAATIGSPFNVLSLVPDLKSPYTVNGYSPLWNVFVAGAPQTKRLTSFSDVAGQSKPAGFVVNCPAVSYYEADY